MVVKQDFRVQYFDDGDKASFYCILRDRWKNLRDYFGCSKYLRKTCTCLHIFQLKITFCKLYSIRGPDNNICSKWFTNPFEKRYSKLLHQQNDVSYRFLSVYLSMQAFIPFSLV